MIKIGESDITSLSASAPEIEQGKKEAEEPIKHWPEEKITQLREEGRAEHTALGEELARLVELVDEVKQEGTDIDNQYLDLKAEVYG